MAKVVRSIYVIGASIAAAIFPLIAMAEVSTFCSLDNPDCKAASPSISISCQGYQATVIYNEGDKDFDIYVGYTEIGQCLKKFTGKYCPSTSSSLRTNIFLPTNVTPSFPSVRNIVCSVDYWNNTQQ